MSPVHTIIIRFIPPNVCLRKESFFEEECSLEWNSYEYMYVVDITYAIHAAVGVQNFLPLV